MKKLTILLVVLLICSVFVNYSLMRNSNYNKEIIQKNNDFNEKVMRFSLLSPRILREVRPDFLFNFLSLREQLHNELDPLTDKFALYFEYLPSGTSIGINSGSEFYAASLFKLPVVMAYFRHKEDAGKVELQKVKLTQEMIDNRFGTLWQKGVGYEIELDEAARLALVESDNTAADALSVAINQEDFDVVYEGLDIDLNITEKGALMTTKNYSSILKSLFYSAVLTHENSQKILSYLSQTEFNDKLVAGIPSDVVVAHKIGVIDAESYKDCGIVYVPNRPYILCMVSKGSEEEANKRMSKISKIVYDYVVSAKSPIPTRQQ